MTYKNLAWLSFPIALAIACGGGGDRKNGFVPDPGTGGVAGSAGSGGAVSSAGAAGSAGAPGTGGSASGDAGMPDSGGESDAGAVGLPDTLCPTTFTRNNEASLQLSKSGDERFGSITDDELVIAYSIPSGAYADVYVASRASASDPFGAPAMIKGAFALDRATLGPDGLSLLVVNADRKGFSLLERADLAKAFEPASTWQYDDIVDGLADDELLGDPVFALGGQVLLYSQYGGGRTHTVVFANRLSTGSAFVVGAELTNPELEAQGDLRRRPSAVSSDYRTLFYYDEVSSSTKAGFFYGGFEFTSVSDLGDARNLQPSPDCSHLYFDRTTTSSDDLFVAESN